MSQITSGFHVSVPTNLCGEGEQLKIGQMSGKTFTTTAHEEDEKETISLQTNYPPPPSAEINTPSTAEDVHKELCDIFLQVVDHALKTFGNV